ncbi:MAG: PAS domain S-box protein, partial [Thermoplasmata archaeon]|nr:PAS domain S-box protein [Thermoplasmata archaeon]
VEIFGYSREELMKMTHLDLIISEDREQMRQIMENAKQTGVALGELEFWVQGKDGTRKYVRTRTSTTLEGGTASEFIITTDITARKMAEDENKRKMMKFLLEDGRLYLVKEFRPSISLEAFNDLLNLDYFGMVLSRTTKKDLAKSIHGPFEHFWLGEKAGEEPFGEILNTIEKMGGKSAILIERLDYLIFKYGFKDTLTFIYRLRDQIYLKEQVVIISMDISTMKEDELNVMEKETNEIEQRLVPKPNEELFEIAQLIYEKNSSGIKPSYSEIGEELKLSKPTFRKRVRRLINAGYAVEVTKGNKKVLELTQKGRSLFFK